jgi:hypothetical protein
MGGYWKLYAWVLCHGSVVIPQLHVMEAQMQFQVSPHGICSGQSGTWIDVFPGTSVSFCQYH